MVPGKVKTEKPRISHWLAHLWALPVFLLCCLNQPDSAKGMALGLMVLTLVVGGLGLRKLRDRMNGHLLLLSLITALGGLSMFYGISGKFALQGFCYLAGGLCLAVLLTLAAPEQSADRWLATVLAVAGAMIALVSIDHVSTRLISGPVLKILSLFTQSYAGVTALEESVRITSIFQAPNVFAGMMGIGVLLSLSLVRTGERGARKLALAALYLNALGFLLAFSLGAVGSLAVAFLVFLILETKERRAELLIVMMQTLVTVGLGLALAASSALAPWTGIRFAPLLAAVLGTALLLAADHHLANRRILTKIRVLPWVAGILAAVGLFALTAWNWTDGITLETGESLRRAAYPKPGHYILSRVGGEDLTVRIEGQDRYQTMMHTETVLYEGPLDGAEFTVNDQIVVYFHFFAGADTDLEQICWQGAEDGGTLPLDYKLLPAFMENRLQGLFANENAIQRLVFFRDGLKLWRRAPLLGNGLGAFEAGLFAVQDFYYETKYVHNHYIQTLLETGIVGLVLFVCLLIFSAWGILRNREHPLAPGLGAALVFMAIHAGVEVVFSSGVYLVFAFGVFGLMGMCLGAPLKKKAGTGILAGIAAMLLAFAVVLGCNLRAAQIGRNAATLEDLRSAAELDPIEWTDYAISFVANAPTVGTAEALEQAEEYLTRLDREESNTLHYYLAKYCFETGQMERAMEMAQKQARATISSSGWWNTVFALVYEYNDGSDAYRRGLEDLVAVMEQWDREHMGTIELEPPVRDFLDNVLGA